MLRNRVALLAVAAGAVSASVWMTGGCSTENEVTDTSANGFCGNGRVEQGEECDDGNGDDTDACTTVCTLAKCGDGIVSGAEACDDGNAVNDDDCSNDCHSNGAVCDHDGEPDEGEECDDGNQVNTDDCTNQCKEPFCGDGIVQMQLGEDCDDGNNEVNDECPPDCNDPGTGGTGGDPCKGTAVFAGVVTNDQNPNVAGPGVVSVWSYGGQLGVTAGNDMCLAIGADHVCTYGEVKQADTNGELSALPSTGAFTFWLHRVSETVPKISNPNEMTAPGPGGRCNDWTYPTNHISDGEYGVYDPAMTLGNPTTARREGNILFFLDDDTIYTGNPTDNHQCAEGSPGCAGSCGGEDPRAILCCFPVCVSQ
jgi:cysteine-rich repeat protein